MTQSYHPSLAEHEGTATDPFADAIERVTLTAEPVAPIRALTAAPRSITLTGPEIPERARFPLAPPGYELVRRLGGGGMGDVFLAREYASARDVAMKFLRSPGSSTGVERFLAEVRALARIDHPNIVKFMATDFYRDQPYFTMEYVSGGNLAERVSAGGPLAPMEAARLIACAARAVHAAHMVQVLHRDLKPSNILLSADGKVKVSDFGLAKLTDLDDSITVDEPLGTPGYMPPEQIARDRGPVGPASDVYGLGATLYYLVTGRAPFVGETKVEIVARVERDLPDRPRALRPDVPAVLEAVALKCLEKDPSARYESAAELADELDKYQAGLGTRALPLTRARRARRWVGRNRAAIGLAAAGVLLAIGLVAAGRQLGADRSSPEQQIRRDLVAGKVVRLLRTDGQPRAPEWPLGPLEVSSSADDGGTCHFVAQDFAVLLLLQDPGIDSYRFRAQVRQTQKAGHVLPTIDSETNQVGLVLGYAAQNGPNGSRGHVATVLAFKEFDFPVKPVDRRLELFEAGVMTGAGFIPAELRTVRDAITVRLRPPEKAEPPWRDVEVEVTPEGIRVTDENGNPRLTMAADIGKRWKHLEEELGARIGSLNGPIGPWSPRLPVGIWVRGSSVSVRNVTIESIK